MSAPEQMHELGRVTADLVVLTVLPEEYEAVRSCLRESVLLRGTHEHPNTCAWRLGMIDASHYGAPFKVAVGMGTPTTTFGALAASQAIRLFDPRHIAFVGVAGGFDRDGQRHRDVVVSSVVTAYEYGKVDTGGFAPRGNFTYRCNEALVRAAAAMAATGAQWWREDENPAGPPRVRTGMIASGDKVIDDPDEAFFVAVREMWPKLLAIEMEGAGVAAAVHEVQSQRAVGFILVRGISDMPHSKAPGAPASTQERDTWKVAASRNAARFLAHLVATAWPIPPREDAVVAPAWPVAGPGPLADASLTSTSPAHAPGTARPMPAYADAEDEALSRRLEDSIARRQKLRNAGVAADGVEREIREIKRQLREGGQLRAGDALGDGRFLLAQVVGRGGFATVWEAHDKVEDRRVAIKVLHSNLAGDRHRRARFFRGAKMMTDLEHPAVVRVLDSKGEDGGFYYFVMEFLAGGDLREAVLRKRVGGDASLALILQIGEALALAHSRGIIHRDIKPANILLDEHGNAKLTDFDLVCAHDTTGGTRTGALGTVIYAAPECLDRPQEATARADVFGLGMTAMFCLSGQELSLLTFRTPEPTIAQLDCSESLRKVIACAVAWEPSRRFADAATMTDALRSALDKPSQGTAEDNVRIDKAAPEIAELTLPVKPSLSIGPPHTADDRLTRQVQEQVLVSMAGGRHGPSGHPAEPSLLPKLEDMTSANEKANERHRARRRQAVERMIKTRQLLLMRFQLEAILGDDGEGMMCRARDVIDEVMVALKIVPATRNEMRITQGLRHERVARLYGGYRRGPMRFIAMEFAPGGSLDRRLKSSEPLKLKDRLRIFQGICEGIKAMHKARVLHLDIRSKNVFLRAANDPMVADFGTSVAIEAGTTSAQPFGGTLGYMSPEHQMASVQGGTVDCRSDVYALGKTLGEIVPEPMRPTFVSRIINQATRADPNDRYSSVSDLLRDLRSARRHRLLIAISISAAIVAAGTLGTVLSSLPGSVPSLVPSVGSRGSPGGAVILYGTSATGAILSTTEVFDLESGQWSDAPYDPIDRPCGARAVALPHGHVLVAGGSVTCQDDGSTTNRVRVFDANNRVWEPLPECQPPCIDLNGDTFVPASDHKAWQPGTCQPSGPCMSYGRDRFTMIALPDGSPFAFGGCAGACNGPNELGQTLAGRFELGRIAEVYNPANGVWSQTPVSLAGRRADAVAVVLRTSVLICGGNDGFREMLRTCEQLNSSFNNRAPSWREAGETPSPVVALAPMPTGAIALLADDAEHAWIWTGDAWQTGPKFAFAQLGGTLTLLRDGRVLLTGGRIGGRVLSTTQILDPSTNEWHALPEMHVARFGHVAVRVAGDRVLVAGGCSGGAQREAEIFRGDTERWYEVSPLRSARCSPLAAEITMGRETRLPSAHR